MDTTQQSSIILNAYDPVSAGRRHLQARQARQALACFQRALREDAGNLGAYYELGNLWLAVGELGPAYRAFDAGLQRAPEHLGLRLQLINVLLQAGETTKAAAQGERVCALAPDDPFVCSITLSMIRKRQGHLPEAVALARDALERQLAAPPRPAISDVVSATGFDSERHETLLWQTLVQLAQAGVHAFPTAGTLLGLTREGRLLPFDKDIDVGLPFVEISRAIACLTQHGWREHQASSGLSNPRAFFHASGLVMDLCGFVVEPDSQHTLSGFWISGLPWAWQRVTEYPTLTLVRETRSEGEVWALREPQAWLAALYGGDWQTPDPLFDTVVGAHNLRGFSLLTEYYACIKIFQSWQRGRTDKALSTLQHTRRHRPRDALFRDLEQRIAQSARK